MRGKAHCRLGDGVEEKGARRWRRTEEGEEGMGGERIEVKAKEGEEKGGGGGGGRGVGVKCKWR